MLRKPYVPVFYLPEIQRPAGFVYPASYVAFASSSQSAALGADEDEWHVLDEAEVEQCRQHVSGAAPQMALVPFMRRFGQNASVACFGAAVPGKEAMVFECSMRLKGHVIGGRCTFSEWASQFPETSEEQ
jgi:hypothetical protein